MIKKITSKLLILGVTVTTLIFSIPAYAVEYYVKDSSQYLNQTIPYNSSQHGWYKFPNGEWGYFIDHNQLIKNSLIHENGDDYAIGNEGRMIKGWFKDTSDHKWHFFRSDGKANKGWLQSDGNWYYFDNTGAMLTDWQKIDERWYYFDKNSGVMACNIKVGNYYLSSDGSLQ